MSTTISARFTSNSRLLAGLAVALLAAGARADVLHVPGDFPTVAEALAAAQPGDEVVLAAGSYNDPILMQTTSGITLRGQGKVVLGGGDLVTAALTLENCNDITVDHLRVESPGGTGVLVDDCENITLSRVRVEDAGSHGFAVGNESGGVLLDRCRVEGAVGSGILFEVVEESTIWRCTVLDAGGHGMDLSEVFGSLVDRCHVSDTGGAGIALGQQDPASGCVLRRNVVTGAGTVGLLVRGTDNVVTDNRVQGAGTFGLHVLAGSVGGIVDDNRLLETGDGVKSDGSGVLFRDNRVVAPELGGFLLDDDGCVLTGNRVLKAGGMGYLFALTMEGGSILDCKAQKPAGHAFLVAASNLQFTGNTSSGAGVNGFDVTGSDNVFTGNTAKGSGGEPVVDGGTGNVFLDNDFQEVVSP